MHVIVWTSIGFPVDDADERASFYVASNWMVSYLIGEISRDKNRTYFIIFEKTLVPVWCVYFAVIGCILHFSNVDAMVYASVADDKFGTILQHRVASLPVQLCSAYRVFLCRIIRRFCICAWL